MRKGGWDYNINISAMNFPLYLTLYNNERLKMEPEQFKQYFTKQRFKYINCKLNLKKWDYRISMTFENKINQKAAIMEIKKLKQQYDMPYHYDFKRNYRLNRYLMDPREYDRIIEHSRKKMERKFPKREKDLNEFSQISRQVSNVKLEINKIEQAGQSFIRWDMGPEQPERTPEETHEVQLERILSNKALLVRLLSHELKCRNK